jgi:excinuclease UvrABC helicase subunit UvrB
MKKKIQDLQDQIDKMFICNDKFIFGNDIYEYIKNYNVKHLYIHTDIKKIFDNVIIEKDLIANLNFNIIEINSIDNNINASNVLLENYSGFIGIKYF